MKKDDDDVSGRLRNRCIVCGRFLAATGQRLTCSTDCRAIRDRETDAASARRCRARRQAWHRAYERERWRRRALAMAARSISDTPR
jgi:ribosomal protein S27AE